MPSCGHSSAAKAACVQRLLDELGVPLGRGSARHEGGDRHVERLDQVCRGQANIEPALPAAYINSFANFGGFIDESTKSPFLTEWTDASSHVAAGPFCVCNNCHPGSLCPRRSSQSFQVELVGDGHDGHDEFALVIFKTSHKRLEDNIGIQPEFVGSFEPKRIGARVVVVRTGLVVDALRLKKYRCRSLHPLKLSSANNASQPMSARESLMSEVSLMQREVAKATSFVR